jgi:CTP synthase (UTP-ammonia lyase)
MNDLIKIGIIGDYDEKKPSHLATNEAIRHCAAQLSMKVEIIWLPTKSLEDGIYGGDGKTMEPEAFDGFFCSPGSPYASYTGAIKGIRFAREHDYPFIGTCGGFQHAVMEYVNDVLGISEVSHAEYNPDASKFFIAPLSCSLVGETKKIYLKKDTVIQKIYGAEEIIERYNCSFGLNPAYQHMFDNSGFHVAGTDENDEVRIFELAGARFYAVTLFQPQLSSTKENPHKLILAYLEAVRKFHEEYHL